MATSVEMGKEGEEIAIAYLKKQGYKILETNWRFGPNNEVDIIAMDKKDIVFVEVKARQKGWVVSPAAAVNRAKQRILIRAANTYIQRYDINENARFDIIALEIDKDSHTLEHIDGAFYPTL